MSVDTRELIASCEQLSAAHRGEISAFAQSLLAERREIANSRDLMDRWPNDARGLATVGVTRDQIMTLTRGDA